MKVDIKVSVGDYLDRLSILEIKKLKGLDSLLSMVQMPKAVPIGCLAIDGAFNAGLLAASIIGNFDSKVKSNLEKWRRLQTQSIKKKPKR